MKKLKGVMVAASRPGSSMAERNLFSVIFTALIVGLTVMAAATPTLAGQPNSQNAANGRFFIGFWEGIDSLDGSTVQMSLSDNDQDGVFDYLYRESFFTVCFTPQNTRGRGILEGTATVAVQGGLDVDADRICKNDDGSDGLLFFGVVPQIRAAPKGDIIIIDFTGFPPIIMHRTGK